MDQQRDLHSGSVPDEVWMTDAAVRERGRVEVFYATRAGGMDGWTMDVRQYDLKRCHILSIIDDESRDDGTVLPKNVVEATRLRYSDHELFPIHHVRNYSTFTKVDLESRCVIKRVVGSGPIRLRRYTGDAPVPDLGSYGQ